MFARDPRHGMTELPFIHVEIPPPAVKPPRCATSTIDAVALLRLQPEDALVLCCDEAMPVEAVEASVDSLAEWARKTFGRKVSCIALHGVGLKIARAGESA